MKRALTLLPSFLFFLAVHSQYWSELAPVPADGRDDAVAFSLHGKGFVVTGNQGGFSESNKLWMYDPASNSWTEKALFPGIPRQYAGVFSIGDAAYIVAGISAGSVPLKDCWKYDFTTDSWTQKADFPGEARWSVFNFELFGKGYVGTGCSASYVYANCWRYDPADDSWEQIANFPHPRRETVAFSCLGKGYVGLGFTVSGQIEFQNDFYAYNPLSGRWQAVADFPGGGRSYATAISDGAVGIVGNGSPDNSAFLNTSYSFDPGTGNWHSLADFPLAVRGMSSFTIAGEVYFLTGLTDAIERTSRMWKLSQVPAAAEQDILIYPNPGVGRHVIRAPEGTRYAVVDFLSRRLVGGVVGTGNAALVEELRPGPYMVELTNETGERLESLMLVVMY